MEALALAIAVVTAIGGWVVNGILARRATRRDLRVTFLLSAYRSLDAASNRPLKTAALREQLENAIADITLIGKEDQVRLATDFARTFAATGGADTSELLEALRSDLRKELLLGKVVPRTTWLRIEAGSQWSEASAQVRASVSTVAIEASAKSPDPLTTTDDAPRSIEDAFGYLVAFLSDLFPDLTKGADIVDAVARSRRLTQPSSQALEGLAIMRALALQSPERVSKQEAHEFVTLVRATEYAVRTEARRFNG